MSLFTPVFRSISSFGILVAATGLTFSTGMFGHADSTAHAAEGAAAEAKKEAEAVEAPAEPYRQPWRDAKNDADIVTHDKNSAVFLGAGVGFGQSRSTKSGTTPDIAFKAYFEPGYQRQLSTWSKMEFSGEVFFGSNGFRKSGDEGYKAKVPVGLGLLAKVGYGYSLGSDLYAVWKVGLGPVMAKYEADAAGDSEVESKGSIWGTAGYLGFNLAMPMTSSLDFNGGVELTHMAFDLGDVRVRSGGATTTVDSDTTINLNVWQATFGLRYKI